jgi:hypothetical protein
VYAHCEDASRGCLNRQFSMISLFRTTRQACEATILKRSMRGSPVRASNSQRGTFEHVKKPTGVGSPRGCLHTKQEQGRGRYPFRESCRAWPPRGASSQ